MCGNPTIQPPAAAITRQLSLARPNTKKSRTKKLHLKHITVTTVQPKMYLRAPATSTTPPSPPSNEKRKGEGRRYRPPPVRGGEQTLLACSQEVYFTLENTTREYKHTARKRPRTTKQRMACAAIQQSNRRQPQSLVYSV